MKFKRLFTLLVSFVISGCSAFARTQPTALPTVVLDSEPTRQTAPQAIGGEVTASGVVVPAQELPHLSDHSSTDTRATEMRQQPPHQQGSGCHVPVVALISHL